MSVSFYIAPYDPKAWENPTDKSEKPTSDLVVDRDIFRTKLFEHWTTARCREEAGKCWILTHADDDVGGDLRVYLHSDQQVVSFNAGPKNIFIEFVLWYRAFVSSYYPLYLFNSSSWDSLHLTLNSTSQDIIDFTGLVC